MVGRLAREDRTAIVGSPPSAGPFERCRRRSIRWPIAAVTTPAPVTTSRCPRCRTRRSRSRRKRRRRRCRTPKRLGVPRRERRRGSIPSPTRTRLVPNVPSVPPKRLASIDALPTRRVVPVNDRKRAPPRTKRLGRPLRSDRSSIDRMPRLANFRSVASATSSERSWHAEDAASFSERPTDSSVARWWSSDCCRSSTGIRSCDVVSGTRR